MTTHWSPEQAFDYLARFSSAEEWDPGVVRAETLNPDPVGPDSEFRLVGRAMGRELPLVYRIVAFDRPHRVTLVADTRRLRSEDTITVEAGADGTSRYGRARYRVGGPEQVGGQAIGFGRPVSTV